MPFHPNSSEFQKNNAVLIFLIFSILNKLSILEQVPTPVTQM